MSPGWFLAPLAAVWAHALLNILADAFENLRSALTWIQAVGPYSGKFGLAMATFVTTAAAFRQPLRAWERWAIVLPGLYLAALVATFPPVAGALAQAVRLALPW